MPRYLLAALAILTATPVFAQNVDRVFYRDPTQEYKLVSTSGIIKESIAGIEILGADKKVQQTIPTNLISRIEYYELPGIASDQIMQAGVLENGQDPAKAAPIYANLLKASATAPEKSKRYIAFREAMLAAKLLDLKTGEEFAADAKAVAEKLTQVSRTLKDSWEAWPTGRTAARIYAENDQSDQAAQVCAELGRIEKLPQALVFEAKLAEIGYILMGGPAKRLIAETAILDLAKETKLSANQKEHLNLLLAVVKLPAPKASATPNEPPAKPAGIDALEANILKAKSALARAAAYNALGEYYRNNAMPREALWAYLWVDTVYNQNPYEQIKAIRRIIQLFQDGNDEERTQMYREKLLQAKVN